ncbi:unnamed protein product [Paramecium sonneborni]|uniref:Uncharacterized protein n=1 Tax=Paramecium sonneborni TaxID=65129 RepID=A0A8S1PJR6_9CILI|nr:unnamed protein product [Paramecium sonneborni]
MPDLVNKLVILEFPSASLYFLQSYWANQKFEVVFSSSNYWANSGNSMGKSLEQLSRSISNKVQSFSWLKSVTPQFGLRYLFQFEKALIIQNLKIIIQIICIFIYQQIA